MSLVLCPECGSKISDKARTCPHCGHVGPDPDIPISEQEKYEIIPAFTYEVVDWESDNDIVLSQEDKKRLFDYFGNWENIRITLPGIADTIQALANNEPILVASMDDYVKKLIADGTYHFTIDKNGEILPTIRDAKKIVKQVRLKEMSFAPQLSQSLNNLAMQATMAQILEEIEYVEEAIRDIHIELQDDRIALAESAFDKLEQAKEIQDTKLREQMILNAISSATDAKHTLMRNFERNRSAVIQHSNQSTLKMAMNFKGEKDIPIKAQDAFQDLMCMVNMVQVECVGYSMLGEYETSKKCLCQFRQYILDNKLTNKGTLLKLNENVKGDLNEIVHEFSTIASRIQSFDKQALISYGAVPMIEGERVNE